MRPDTGREYTVTWAIEVYADTPEEAAREALRIQRDPESMATVFTVQAFPDGGSVNIDLEDIDAQIAAEG